MTLVLRFQFVLSSVGLHLVVFNASLIGIFRIPEYTLTVDVIKILINISKI